MESVLEATGFFGLGLGKGMGAQEFGDRQDGKGGISGQEDYEKPNRQNIGIIGLLHTTLFS